MALNECVNTKGGGVRNKVRAFANSPYCPGETGLICCNLTDTAVNPVPESKLTILITYTIRMAIFYNREFYFWIVTSGPSRRKPQPLCGARNRNGIGRQNSLGKTAAKFGEWPHMCAIKSYDRNGEKQFICGASLITPGVLLTAAHCVL